MEDKLYQRVKNLVKEVTQNHVQQIIEESTRNTILNIEPEKREILEAKIRKTPVEKLERRIQNMSDSTVREIFKSGPALEEIAVYFEKSLEDFFNTLLRNRLLPIMILIIAAGLIALAVPTNNPPTTDISSITPNPAHTGENITFQGTATDPDGDEIQEYWWWSSIDGFLGNTPTLTLNNLSPGYHMIHFKAHDSRGSWSMPAIKILEIRTEQSMPSNPEHHRTSRLKRLPDSDKLKLIYLDNSSPWCRYNSVGRVPGC